MITLGVEEEYLLLDSATGLPVARAAAVRRAAGLHDALAEGEVQRELLQAQLEIATPVCHSLDEVGGHLLRMRHSLDAAAREAGCLLAACGGAPFNWRLPVPVTPTDRYRAMHAHAPRLTDEQLIAGMHVHVGVPDRQTGVVVLNRLRPWLPLLVALAANSPMWQGVDTGFASWRTLVFGRWPVSGAPPSFTDATDYRQRVDALVANGLIPDTGQIYWHIRLSEHYPTVEVRAMDVQLRPDEAVMLTGVVRALAARALTGGHGHHPVPELGFETLSAALWHAARHGTATVFDPVTGGLVPATEAVATLLTIIDDGPEGDRRHIVPVLERLLREGNGAVRQRRTLRSGGTAGLLRMITDETGGA
ncbi:glutamate--cysteine ligase [Kitasatospora sp. NPDC008115]|uniref:carboxylate-amine ligase n=1 Tax=Kitasatospora sp. NPDC008115 TaxID=3364022 RepID=UPI0036E1F79E